MGSVRNGALLLLVVAAGVLSILYGSRWLATITMELGGPTREIARYTFLAIFAALMVVPLPRTRRMEKELPGNMSLEQELKVIAVKIMLPMSLAATAAGAFAYSLFLY